MRSTWTVLLLLAACAGGGSTNPAGTDEPNRPPDGARAGGAGPRPHGRSSPGQAALDKAKKAARENDLDGAIGFAREALTADAKLEEAYLLVGSICSLKHDAECTGATYDQGLAALKDSPSLLHARGMFALESQKLDQAIKDLEQAHQLTGAKDSDVDADLAYAYVFADRLDDAEKTASAARALSPKAFAPAFVLGEICYRKERWADAISAYEAAVKINPEDGLAERRLAMAYGKGDHHQEALAIYDRLLKGGADPGLHVGRAGELVKLGRAKDAVAAMKEAIKLAPKEPKLLELLLRAQEAAGDKDGASHTRAQISAHGK